MTTSPSHDVTSAPSPGSRIPRCGESPGQPQAQPQDPPQGLPAAGLLPPPPTLCPAACAAVLAPLEHPGCLILLVHPPVLLPKRWSWAWSLDAGQSQCKCRAHGMRARRAWGLPLALRHRTTWGMPRLWPWHRGPLCPRISLGGAHPRAGLGSPRLVDHPVRLQWCWLARSLGLHSLEPQSVLFLRVMFFCSIPFASSPALSCPVAYHRHR